MMTTFSLRRLFLWTSLIVGLLIVTVAVTAFLSPSFLGKRLSGFAGGRLDRQVVIEGPFRIQWNWRTPHVYAEQVKIANLPGADEPDMVNIGKIDFKIHLWPLLRGRTELPYLHLADAHILLERRDAEHANWDFPAFSAANAAASAALPSTRGDMPLIGRLEVENSAIVYRDTPRDLTMDLQMNMAQGVEEGHEKFSFAGKGTLAGKTFDVRAEGGSLEMLRDTDKDFPLKLDLAFGLSKISLDGTFRDPVRLKGLKAALKAEGPNLADIFYLTHIPLPPTPAYTIAGILEKDGLKWSFSGFSGKIGSSDIAGDIVHDTSGRQALTTGTVRAHHLAVADMGGFIGMAPRGAKLKSASPAQKTLAREEAASPYLLPDTPLDLKRLRASDMDLTLDAEKLDAPGWPLSDMHARFRIENGLLRVDPLRFGVADGTVQGTIALDGRQDTPEAKITLGLHRLSLRRFFGGSKFDDFSKGYFGGSVALTGSGASLAQVLGAADGRIVIVMSGGRISLLLVRESNLDVAQTLPALLFGKDTTTEVRCGIGDFSVQKGLLTSRAFLLDTAASNLQGSAKINLKDETIDASIDAHPKDPSLLALQSKILLTGSLKKPVVAIDPLSTGLRAAAAVVLGGLALPAAFLPYIELGLGKDSDCGALVAAAEEPAAGGSGKPPK